MQREENARLLKAVAEGDGEALTQLTEANMGLVKSIASRFGGRGTDIDDLIQIGCIGMLKAAKSFDFSYNTEFSTYAVPVIIGEIRRFLRDDGQIKVSRTVKRNGIAALKKAEDFAKEHNREPTISELADLCSMEAEELTFTLEAMSPVHSLSESVGEDTGLTLESLISSRENEIEKLTDRIALSQAVKRLDRMSRQILHLRYTKELSQQQTGEILGISQVKVSRSEKKIMETLRKTL